MVALLVLALVFAALAAPVLFRSLGQRATRSHPRRHAPETRYDPGRERRAEQRARELLRSCVNEEEWAMYRDLGFVRVFGRARLSGQSAAKTATAPSYAYLIYPHKPIVAYVPADGRLLSEYCVEFPDVQGGGRTRLPASDDVLAKWMALTSDESRVIGRANMHLVGRQLDPTRIRRDLWRLSEWEHQREGSRPAEAHGA